MFVFEQKGSKEVLRASPQILHVTCSGLISVWFQLGLSNSRCTSGVSCLPPPAVGNQLCFLPCAWNLAGGQRGQPKDEFALGSTEAGTLLSACGFIWGRVQLYLRHLLDQTEHFSSSPNPSTGPVCLPLLGTGGLCCCLCRA